MAWTLTPAAGNRYFNKPDGTVLYFTGSHGWMDCLDLFRTTLPNTPPGTPSATFDFTGYLNWMAAQHYSYMRLWLSDQTYGYFGGAATSWRYSPVPYARPGPANAVDNLPKYDLDTWNQAYFDRLFARCNSAAASGVYVGINLFFIFNAATSGWNYHPFRSVNNIQGFNADPGATGLPDSMYTLATNQAATLVRQKAFVKKVIDTVNNLDNILYEVGNELPFGSLAAAGGGWQNAICDYIHTYEAGLPKQHPVGISAPMWDGGTGSPYNNLLASHADWIAPPGHDGNHFEGDPPQAVGNKIHILDVDHLFPGDDANGNQTLVFAGQWVWKGFLRGYNVIHMDDLYNLGLTGTSDTGWARGYEPYRTTQKQTAQYAARCNLATTVPHSELCSTGFCIASPGVQYLALQPSTTGGAFTVNLSSGSGKTFSVEWYDIANSTTQTAADVSGGSATQSFAPPWARASVLFLNALVGQPPAMTTTIYKITENTAINYRQLFGPSVSDTGNTQYVVTGFFKSADRAIYIQLSNAAQSAGINLAFNPITGAIISTVSWGSGMPLPTGVSIVDSGAGDGFKKFQATFTSSARVESIRFSISMMTTGGGGSYGGNGTSFVEIYSFDVLKGTTHVYNSDLTTYSPSNLSVAAETAAPPPSQTGGIIWRGAWASTTSYAVNDAVSSGGSSYIAMVAGTNSQPPSANWNLIAQKGDQGAQGAPGATGPQGPQGPQGPAGSGGATPVFTATVNGLVPAPEAVAGRVLSDNGSWVAQPTSVGGGAYQSVKNFGAVGDGVADDTQAILRAMRARSGSRGTIFFPTGKYLVTSTLSIAEIVHEQITFLGEGSNVADGSGSAIIGNMNGWVFERGIGDRTDAKIQFANLTVSGGGLGCIRIIGATGVLVQNCGFFSNGVGLCISSNEGPITVRDNNFQGPGVGCYLGGVGMNVTGNNFQRCNDTGLIINGLGAVVMGNRFEVNGIGLSLGEWRQALTGPNPSPGGPFLNILTLKSCTFEGNGIHITGGCALSEISSLMLQGETVAPGSVVSTYGIRLMGFTNSTIDKILLSGIYLAGGIVFTSQAANYFASRADRINGPVHIPVASQSADGRVLTINVGTNTGLTIPAWVQPGQDVGVAGGTVPAGTTVSAVDRTNNTITLSAPATGAIWGVRTFTGGGWRGIIEANAGTAVGNPNNGDSWSWSAP